MPRAVRRWLGHAVTSSPNSSTRPDDAARMPVMRLNSVVLPAPFGPMMALRSPGMICSETPRTARKPPNAFDRSWSSSTGPRPLVGCWFTKVTRTLESDAGIPVGKSWRCRPLLAIFAGREVAAIDRLMEEGVLAVSPELADGRIGLDHDVPKLRLVVAE